MKIRSGDKVIVISGKDRGTEGVVKETFPKNNKVLIEGVNTVQRHTKPTGEDNPGGIVDKDMPIDVSNVAVVSPKDGKPTRVAMKIDGKEKVRVCARTGAVIEEAK